MTPASAHRKAQRLTRKGGPTTVPPIAVNRSVFTCTPDAAPACRETPLLIGRVRNVTDDGLPTIEQILNDGSPIRGGWAEATAHNAGGNLKSRCGTALPSPGNPPSPT